MKRRNDILLNNILKLMKDNPSITEVELAKILGFTERNIRRSIKILKDEDKVKLIRNGKERYWQIYT